MFSYVCMEKYFFWTQSWAEVTTVLIWQISVLKHPVTATEFP